MKWAMSGAAIQFTDSGSVEVRHAVGVIEAENAEIAEAIALKKTHESYPQSRGWTHHDAKVMAV